MSAISGVGSSGQLQTDYLNLLITQLRNQDPTSPMDNSQMSMQLAQLSQLEQMENLNSNFAQVLYSQQLSQATSLIGHNVSFIPDGAETAVIAKVDGVTVKDGVVALKAGEYTIDTSVIQSIQ